MALRDHERLLPGPAIAGHTIQHDEAGAAFLIDQQMVYCTRAEYTLLQILLQHADHLVRFEHLLRCLDGDLPTDARACKLARGRLAHYVSGVRPKIWAVGLDVGNVMKQGYILLSSQADDPAPGEREERSEVERVN